MGNETNKSGKVSLKLNRPPDLKADLEAGAKRRDITWQECVNLRLEEVFRKIDAAAKAKGVSPEEYIAHAPDFNEAVEKFKRERGESS